MSSHFLCLYGHERQEQRAARDPQVHDLFSVIESALTVRQYEKEWDVPKLIYIMTVHMRRHANLQSELKTDHRWQGTRLFMNRRVRADEKLITNCFVATQHHSLQQRKYNTISSP